MEFTLEEMKLIIIGLEAITYDENLADDDLIVIDAKKLISKIVEQTKLSPDDRTWRD